MRLRSTRLYWQKTAEKTVSFTEGYQFSRRKGINTIEFTMRSGITEVKIIFCQVKSPFMNRNLVPSCAFLKSLFRSGIFPVRYDLRNSRRTRPGYFRSRESNKSYRCRPGGNKRYCFSGKNGVCSPGFDRYSFFCKIRGK